MIIRFYYNDGNIYQHEIKRKQEAYDIELGVLRGLYKIALKDPNNFNKHFLVGYELLEDDKIIDSHLYVKVGEVKK